MGSGHRGGVPRKAVATRREELEPLQCPVQRKLSSLLLVHVVSIEIVYCESLSATGLSKT